MKLLQSSSELNRRLISRQLSKIFKALSEVTLSQYLSVRCVGGVWKYLFDNKWMGEYDSEAQAVAARDEYYLANDRYPGVSFDKKMNKWLAQYSLNGKLEQLGRYDSLNGAAAVVKRVESSTDVKATIKDIQASYKASSEVTPSQYLNVGCMGGVWKFRFEKGAWMNEYGTEAEAVAARDKYYLGKGRYPGVSFNKTRNKWDAQYPLNGKLEQLGSYDSLNGAAAVITRVESSTDVKATIKDIQASYKATVAASKASSSSSSRPSSSANNNDATPTPTDEERSIARRKKIVKLENEIAVLEEIESNQQYSDSIMANNLHLVHLQKETSALIKEELKDA